MDNIYIEGNIEYDNCFAYLNDIIDYFFYYNSYEDYRFNSSFQRPPDSFFASNLFEHIL
jgi:hypothetical protein